VSLDTLVPSLSGIDEGIGDIAFVKSLWKSASASLKINANRPFLFFSESIDVVKDGNSPRELAITVVLKTLKGINSFYFSN